PTGSPAIPSGARSRQSGYGKPSRCWNSRWASRAAPDGESGGGRRGGGAFLLLAIDVGNTNVSFGLFAGDDHRLLHTWRIATDRRRTEDEYEVILHQLFQRHRIDPGDVREVAMGTVVPPVR